MGAPDCGVCNSASGNSVPEETGNASLLTGSSTINASGVSVEVPTSNSDGGSNSMGSCVKGSLAVSSGSIVSGIVNSVSGVFTVNTDVVPSVTPVDKGASFSARIIGLAD